VPAGVLPPLGEASAAAGQAVRASAADASPAPVTAPMTPSACQAAYGTPCYSADLLREIYGLTGMRNEGQGATVALIMPYRNPVLRHDLDTYASQAGLPVPDLHISEVGHPVTASTGNFDQTIASQEGELDAEMILAMAPKVRLDYIQTQTDFSLSPGGFSYAASLLQQLPALRPEVDAVSFSLGSSEENYAEQAGSTAAGDAVIRQQSADISAAAGSGITVMASTGDTGPASSNLAGTAVYPQPAVYFPASDPQVTGVSGTQVHAGDDGVRTGPDSVWSNDGDGGATGGGLSTVFTRPSYQDPYASLTGNHRGVGDAAMDGASDTPVWMYTSKYNIFTDQAAGWVRVAGTSASSPLFTGIVALAAAQAGHPLGDINPALYAMARHGAADGIAPVTSGCNTDDGIQGYCATAGPWSLPDGNGTIDDAARFVPALAAAASRR
jgi:subtilase family serine protease